MILTYMQDINALIILNLVCISSPSVFPLHFFFFYSVIGGRFDYVGKPVVQYLVVDITLGNP